MPDGGVNLGADDAFDIENDAAIVKQEDISVADILRQVLVVESDALQRAALALGIKDESRAVLKENLSLGKLADANLRPLEIGQDADRTADSARGITDHRRPVDVILGRAMGKIHAHDIDAGTDQFFQPTFT